MWCLAVENQKKNRHPFNRLVNLNTPQAYGCGFCERLRRRREWRNVENEDDRMDMVAGSYPIEKEWTIYYWFHLIHVHPVQFFKSVFKSSSPNAHAHILTHMYNILYITRQSLVSSHVNISRTNSFVYRSENSVNCLSKGLLVRAKSKGAHIHTDHI